MDSPLSYAVVRREQTEFAHKQQVECEVSITSVKKEKKGMKMDFATQLC